MDKTGNFKGGMIRGAIWLTVSGLIVKCLGLIYKIPLSYILSDEGMGYFNSAYTVYTFFFIICTTGIPKAISIMTAEAESEGEVERVRRIYKSAFTIFFAFGLIMSIVFLLAAKPFSQAIGSTQAYFTMVAISPSIFFTCISGVIRGYFNGKLTFAPIAVAEAVSGVARLILGLLFAYAGYKINLSYPIISALTILGTTLGSFLGFLCLLIYKKCNDKVARAKEACRSGNSTLYSAKITGRLIKLSAPITLTAAISSICAIADLAVIMKRLQSIGFSELQSSIIYGNYTTLVVPMLNLVGTLIVPLTTVLLPFVSKESKLQKQDNLSERVSFIMEVLSFVVFPAATVFTFRAKEVLVILFEDSSAYMASPLLCVLGPAMLFMSFTSVLNTVLEGMGETRVPLISLTVGASVKILLTLILIGNKKIEVLGAPIGTGFSYLISFLISLCYLKTVKHIKTDIISKTLPAMFSSVFSIMICGIVKHKFFTENTRYFIIELLLFALLYGFLISAIKAKSIFKATKHHNRQKNAL